MLQSERHEQILHLLAASKFLKVKDLEQRFNISRSTAIRDIEELANAGLADRTYGGIKRADSVLPKHFTCELYSRALNSATYDAKEQIAAAAVARLDPGSTLFVDGGTTTQQLCHHLTEIDFHIITNSLSIACFFAENSSNEVLLTGGLLHRRGRIMIGPHAQSMVESIHADWFIASSGGIDEQGLTNTDLLTVEIERKMIEQSSQVMILADHTKFGRKTLTYFVNFDAVDILITNRQPRDSIVEAIGQGGTELVVV
ncbi:DeoR/GlpR transcriptional regulator [candidate division KSB1 bacterium]|nr:DeoR/GlpR transcriptional regulator [candidate division KSB1 bacterium]